MVKEKERDQKIMVGFVWSYKDLKFIISSLLLIFLLATLFQFLPYRFLLSPSDLRSCLSKLSATNPLNNSLPMPQSLLQEQKNSSFDTGSVIKRVFNPVGSAAYLFIQMGAYRGGLNTFAVVGLASKPIHVYSKPEFHCEWFPHNNRSATVMGSAYKMLPDWGYSKVYTIVVVKYTFATDVGADGSGGQLVITATNGG